MFSACSCPKVCSDLRFDEEAEILQSDNSPELSAPIVRPIVLLRTKSSLLQQAITRKLTSVLDNVNSRIKLKDALNPQRWLQPGGLRKSTQVISMLLSRGRVQEAQRELDMIDGDQAKADLLEALGADVVTRIERISGRIQDSSKAFAVDSSDGWVTEQFGKGAEYSYRLSGHEFVLISCADCDGVDIVKALAAFVELDLCQGYKSNVLDAKCLSAHDAVDSLWHIRQRGRISGGMEDNIMRLSVVDGLDDSSGALWASIYTVDAGATEADGIRLPPPGVGATREVNAWTTAKIEPTISIGGAFPVGFRLSVAVYGQPSKTTMTALSWMPGFAFRELMKKGALEQTKHFLTHLNECEELGRRVKSSQRKEFYEEVRRRLLTFSKKHMLSPRAYRRQRSDSIVKWLARQPTNRTMSDDAGALDVASLSTEMTFGESKWCPSGAVSGDDNDSTMLVSSPIQGDLFNDDGVGFRALSTVLPKDWADYAE